jgi:glycosyltransferase involved in cell wall biosynthesis
MRIVHLSTDDALHGAGRAAGRLHAGLRRLGYDSMMVVARRRGTDPAVRKFEPPRDLASKVRRRLRGWRIRRDMARYAGTRPTGYETFSDDRTEEGAALVKQLPPCDVINLHHIAGLVDHEGFFGHLPPGVPLVWRLADMGPLTGGCHYDADCGRFEQRCGACPQLGSTDEHDLSRQIWTRKHRALSGLAPGRLHLVATSRWIAGQARRSSLLRDFPLTVIPNGLDTADFQPRDRGLARDRFGLPRSARVVLFVASSLQNRRKGFGLLVEALAGLEESRAGGGDDGGLVLASVGSKRADLDLPVPHVHLGFIDDDQVLSLAYSAADLFVIPSLQESFGQTVSESLACGTPVVGFATGGMLDMVRPGETGALAPVGDAVGLRGAIREVLDIVAHPAGRAKAAETCRTLAVNEYAMEVQARRFAALYESLISTGRTKATGATRAPKGAEGLVSAGTSGC